MYLAIRFVLFLSLIPADVYAADFEGSLRNIVTVFVGRILPVCALPFVAKNAFGWIQGDPEAVRSSSKVIMGVVSLLGINGLWALLQSQIR